MRNAGDDTAGDAGHRADFEKSGAEGGADCKKCEVSPVFEAQPGVQTACNTAAPRDAAYWAKVTEGRNFLIEVHLDVGKFNSALWSGRKGDALERQIRSNADLRQGRAAMLAAAGCESGRAAVEPEPALWRGASMRNRCPPRRGWRECGGKGGRSARSQAERARPKTTASP